MNVLGRVLEFIRRADHGVTLQEVCSRVKLERHTVSKYLESLRSQGLVSFKQAGMSKIWFASKHPLIEILRENKAVASGVAGIADAVGTVAIVNRDFVVEWSNAVSSHSSCFETLGHSKEMCTNCPAHKTMQTGKTQQAKIDGKLVITKPLKNEDNQVIGVVEIRK